MGKKSYLVLWFKNGELYKAAACRGKIKNRIANAWNEYAQAYNRIGSGVNLVAIATAEDAQTIATEHRGLPTRTEKEVLAKRRMLRKLFDLPVLKTIQ